MNFIKLILIILIITACSDQSYVAESESLNSGKLSDDNVFKDYESALDKAKDVEQTIMDAADNREKEMQKRGY